MKEKLAALALIVGKGIVAGMATGIGLEVADDLCTFVKGKFKPEKKRVELAE